MLNCITINFNKAQQMAPDSIVIVSADASAPHQSVINVMDAARRANLPKLTFATQSSGGAGER